jgi:thiamine-monophosphate kinase
MAEHELIRAFRDLLGVRGGRVLHGSGDDAAVVRADGVAVTSIDSVVDGVHFERSTHSPADIGHKALARGLSDLAAMGADAGEAYVALVVPDDIPPNHLIELGAAMAELAAATGTTVAGGDVTSGPALALSVAVVGWAASAGELVYRNGGNEGDVLGVTGDLGAAAAGLLLLSATGRPSAGYTRTKSPSWQQTLVDRHRRPQPRLAAGRALAQAGVSSMIDVSDGVATDAGHLADASGVAIEISLEALPIAAGVEAVADAAGISLWELAAAGGDDYELLFTAAPEKRKAVEAAAKGAGTCVRWLGRVGAGAGVTLVGAGGEPVELVGFEHLRRAEQ